MFANHTSRGVRTLAFSMILTAACGLSACGGGDTSATQQATAETTTAADTSIRALEIADEILEASGGAEAWEATRFITWMNHGKRLQVWDKQTGDIRMENDAVIVLMNLEHLKSVSRAGSGPIFVAAKILQSRGGRMIVCGASEEVAGALSNMGFDSLIEFRADEAAALADLRRELAPTSVQPAAGTNRVQSPAVPPLPDYQAMQGRSLRRSVLRRMFGRLAERTPRPVVDSKAPAQDA